MTEAAANAAARSQHWRELGHKLIVTIVVVFGLTLLIGFVDPFGMEGVVKSHAGEILQRLTAPFYAWRNQDPRNPWVTPGQQAVTVVLIDQKYMDAVYGKDAPPRWPLPVANLASGVLQPIADAKPAAIFVDIGFPDAPREIVDDGSNSRAEAMTDLAKRLWAIGQQTPLFIADRIRSPDPLPDGCDRPVIGGGAVTRDGLLAPQLRRDLFERLPAETKRTSRIAIVDASWDGSDAYYPLGPVVIGDHAVCHDDEEQIVVPSPALALFKTYIDGCAPARRYDICGPLAPIGRSIVDKGLAGGAALYSVQGAAAGTVALRWSDALSPMTRQAFSADGRRICRDQFYAHWYDPFRGYLSELFGPLARWTTGKEQPRKCAYIDTLSAANLVGERAADPKVTAFLTDRLVLVGADVPQAQDRFRSPVNDDLPGVYFHAVALENLISDGVHYKRLHPAKYRFKMLIFTSILTGVMTLIWEGLVHWSARRIHPMWGPIAVTPPIYFVLLFVVMLMILAIFSFTSLPLVEVAVPIMALHVILFSEWLTMLRETLHKGLHKALGRLGHAKA
jgi:CHASE2 domain-containing sensor protein